MIVIGRLHTGAVLPEWLIAWEELKKPISADGAPGWNTYSSIRQVVHHARNEIVAHTLANHPDATHVFFLDDDVCVPPDGLLRLLADSQEHDLAIVTGLYLQRGEPYFPTVYRHVGALDGDPAHVGHHVQITAFVPGLQEIDACGAGCLLIRTDVLRAIAATGQKPFDYLTEFDCSEDMAFCVRAKRLGYRLALDFDVACQHLTTIAVTYETFQARAKAGIAFSSDALAALSQQVRPITDGAPDSTADAAAVPRDPPPTDGAVVPAVASAGVEGAAGGQP